MALDAPAHGQLRGRNRHPGEVGQIVDDVLSRLGVHLLHGLDAAVTGLALEPRRDVILVGELRMLGNLEDAHPRDGLLLFPERVKLLHLRVALGGHDLVTPHASLHRRQAGRAAPPGARVAVLAVEAIRPRVDDVAEQDGLDGTLTLLRHRQHPLGLVGRIGQSTDIRDDLVDRTISQLRLEGRHQLGQPDRLGPIRDDLVQEVIGQGVHHRAEREILRLDGKVGAPRAIAQARVAVARSAILRVGLLAPLENGLVRDARVPAAGVLDFGRFRGGRLAGRGRGGGLNAIG